MYLKDILNVRISREILSVLKFDMFKNIEDVFS